MDKELSRIRSFDGLRVIAAAMIVIYHTLSTLNVSIIYIRPSVTFLFVIFFMGSGFFISRLLLTEFQRQQKIDILRFYLRRILRTWPVYFIGMAITILLFGPPPDLWKYFLFVQNFYPPGFYIHSWTLAVEEQFYLVSPFIILLVVYTSRPNIIYISLLLVSIFLRWYWGIYLGNSNHTLQWTDALLLGMMFSHPANQFFIELIKNNYRFIQFVSVIIFIILYYNEPLFGPFYRFLWAFTAICFCFSTLANKSVIGKFLSLSFFRYWAERSYAVYTFHLIAVYLITTQNFMVLDSLTRQILAAMAVLLLSALFAEISWRLIENPILLWRNRITAFRS